MNKKELNKLCKEANLSSMKTISLINKARNEIAKFLGYQDYSNYAEKVDENWSDWYKAAIFSYSNV